jgi:hypothetical protein
MKLWAWCRRTRPEASPPSATSSETAELGRLEFLAEQAYAAIYDVPPLHSAKGDYEDACLWFQRAIDEATRLGLPDEVARLTQRLDHVRAVYNSQFRGF